MDRIIPFDQIGLPSPGRFQNAAPSSGIEGSIVNADFFEAVQGELLNLQDEAGLTRNSADLTQILQALRSGKIEAFADTGSADALVVTPRTAYTALGLGVPIRVLKNSAPNATTTPTLSVNGLVRQIVKEDGSALAVGDLPGGSLFSVVSDGSKFRVVGLRKSDAAAAASTAITNSNTVNTATTNIINKNSDAGLTSISAFTANNVGVSDIAVVPNFTLIQSTGFFSGATAVRVNGSGAIRNNTSSNGVAGATLRWGLYDASTSTVVAYGPYLGGGVPLTGAQVAYTVPEHVFQGLNSTHQYCIQMLAQKGSGDGAELAFDTSIDALHNGTNS